MKGRGAGRRFQKGHPGIGGRPDVRLRDDPDGDAVSTYEALTLLGMKPKQAGLFVAAHMMGGRFTMNDASLAHLSDENSRMVKAAYNEAIKNLPDGDVVVPIKARIGSRFSTRDFGNRGKAIQRKAKEAWDHPEDRRWLYYMALSRAYALISVYMRLKAEGVLPELPGR